jgi:hypothetical protein
MFDFFNKKKKPKVRFYSLQPGLAEAYPVIPATTHKRPWFNEQEPHPQDGMSSVNCPGIKLLINSGWIVTAPADFGIRTSGDGLSFQFREATRFDHFKDSGPEGEYKKYVGQHDDYQAEPLLDCPHKQLKTILKLDTPWRFDIDDEYMLLQLPVSYNKESRFQACPGYLDPRYGHVVNVQMYWLALNDDHVVKAGTPICQLIPVRRDEYMSGMWDVSIDTFTEHDEKRERAFNYAIDSKFLNEDNLKSRLKRVRAVLNKYRI